MANHRKESGFQQYARLTLGLTDAERSLMESTDALRELSYDQLAMVLAALYEE